MKYPVIATAVFISLTTFLRYSGKYVPDSFKTNPKHLNSDSYPIHTNLTPESLLPTQHHHLVLIDINFQTFSTMYLSKTSHYNLQILLGLTAQNQIICIQETRQCPLFFPPPETLIISSPSPFHLFHHCIYMHVGESRRHNTTLSHTIFSFEMLALTPFPFYAG